MATTQRTPRRVAVDTGALLALASTRDQYHQRARRTAEQLRATGARLTGHTLVLGELHGHLIRRSGPSTARRVIGGLMDDRACDWVEVNNALLERALSHWIDRFGDQRFSLTDAVTFELMRERRITHAFAFDVDFQTAGFVLL